MKCMNRNKQTFYYALYKGQTEVLDEYGNSTGQYEKSYENPAKSKANISAAKGDVSVQQFGDSLDYSRTIAIDNGSPIDEYSVLWIDTVPALAEDGSLEVDEEGKPVTPYDYIVRQVAKSLNNTLIAIQKVDVQ